MRARFPRRLATLTVAGALLLVMAALAPTASAKPAASAHVVQANYIAEIPNLGLKGVQRSEGITNAVGGVVFGYYEHTSIAGSNDASKATVESIRFFTLESGAPAAELVGHECWYLGQAAGNCGAYHVILSDGDPVGQPDTFCGGPATDPDPANWPCFSWEIVSGNVAIY